MESQRIYEFDWDNTVGADMKLARPKLGPTASVEIYRLLQFTLRDVLEQHYGSKMTDNLFREAGVMAGKAFYGKFLSDVKDVSTLVVKIQESFTSLGIGIFRVEDATENNARFIFTVEEDLDCSGLPDTSSVVCAYAEGFIKGIMESFSKKQFDVREVDCWCTGSRICRFEAKIVP
jgi:predicted hydrocarbon binding protein